jgi:hypothetical protein
MFLLLDFRLPRGFCSVGDGAREGACSVSLCVFHQRIMDGPTGPMIVAPAR